MYEYTKICKKWYQQIKIYVSNICFISSLEITFWFQVWLTPNMQLMSLQHWIYTFNRIPNSSRYPLQNKTLIELTSENYWEFFNRITLAARFLHLLTERTAQVHFSFGFIVAFSFLIESLSDQPSCLVMYLFVYETITNL